MCIIEMEIRKQKKIQNQNQGNQVNFLKLINRYCNHGDAENQIVTLIRKLNCNENEI